MKYKLILFLLIPCTFGFSQEVSKERTWIIKFNPTQLIDFFSFPTVALGVEKKINRFSSINTEFGYQLYDDAYAQNDTSYFCDKGYKINLEYRIYVVPLFNSNFKGKAKNIFVGAQGFYRWNQFDSSRTYYTDENFEAATKIVDYFGARKTCVGANLTIGYQYIWQRLAFEPFIGVGYIDRTVKNYNRMQSTQKYYVDSITTIGEFYFADEEEDSGDTYNFTMGFRIGYTF